MNTKIENLEDTNKRLTALSTAIAKNCSKKWTLNLWSKFIKTRDGFRCVCCESLTNIQAHHIIRKTLYPSGSFELGNGITLCTECHKRAHTDFNGRPSLVLPIGEEQGDNQDDWSFLFGLLRDDAANRNLDQDKYYFIGDHMLKFFTRTQGYKEWHEWTSAGEMTRLEFAHEIWRGAPEQWYSQRASALATELLINRQRQ